MYTYHDVFGILNYVIIVALLKLNLFKINMANFSFSNSTLKKTVVLTGLLLGAFTLSAFAANWSAPSNNPPTCPDGTPGCDAPLNVSNLFQNKSGKVGLGTLNTYSQELLRPQLDVNGKGLFSSLGVVNDLVVGGNSSSVSLRVTGGNPVAGQVLTADGPLGLAKWANSTGSGSGINIGLASSGTLGATKDSTQNVSGTYTLGSNFPANTVAVIATVDVQSNENLSYVSVGSSYITSREIGGVAALSDHDNTNVISQAIFPVYYDSKTNKNFFYYYTFRGSKSGHAQLKVVGYIANN